MALLGGHPLDPGRSLSTGGVPSLSPHADGRGRRLARRLPRGRHVVTQGRAKMGASRAVGGEGSRNEPVH